MDQLVASSSELRENFLDAIQREKYKDETKDSTGSQDRFKSFVCAIKLGNGFGKTHILRKAPAILMQVVSISRLCIEVSLLLWASRRTVNKGTSG